MSNSPKKYFEQDIRIALLRLVLKSAEVENLYLMKNTLDGVIVQACSYFV